MPKGGTIAERTVQLCAILLATIYLISGLAYLCLDYWSVTQQDFWRIFDICLNNSWLHSAIYKFNGHSLFFPSFVWLADLRFFHGNQAVIFYASLALLIASTGLLLLPLWRDATLDPTTRLLGMLVIIGVTFWMGRASITVSGGFNCMASFVMLGLAWAFCLLPAMDAAASSWWAKSCLLICAGYIASFSFGTGLAIWPCLLFLGWCLRLPWRSLGATAAGAMTAGLIFHFLPPKGGDLSLLPTGSAFGPLILEALNDFCRLMGAPILYCTTAWQGKQVTVDLTKSSSLLLFSGAAGLMVAAIVAATYFFRRNLRGRTLEITGLGLITFNVAALLLVVAGRLVYFRDEPGQIAAPRYLFWSSLFWAGLLLLALGQATRQRWLRWPSVLLVLLAPVLGWQIHREEGIHWRYSKLLTEQSATGLINGVYDPDQMLSREMPQIKLLTPQLRSRRLDMFAAGFQEWIGQPIEKLFERDRLKNRFLGDARIEPLPDNQDGPVRVVGHLRRGNRPPPPVMVILDSQGVVVGIARSFVTSRWLDALLFDNRISHAPLRGYIRRYDPAARYAIRSVENRRLSDGEIEISRSLPKN